MPRKRSDEILSELAAADDRLQTKPIGIWSLWKLARLLLYFKAFTTACKSVGGGYYVDGFAGPGLCRVRNAQPLPYFAWGSPMLALRASPKFEKCFLVELNERSANTLATRCLAFGDRAAVHQQDANIEVARIVRENVPPWAPCFCLFDQQGTELIWDTLLRVARTPRSGNKPELLILFPLRMSLLRMLSVHQQLTTTAANRMSESFGTSEWRRIYEERVRGDITPSEAQIRYLGLYCERLKGLGYRVQSQVITAPRSQGMARQEMYHLVFATESDLGEKIMKDVFRRPYALDFPVTAQTRLFD